MSEWVENGLVHELLAALAPSGGLSELQSLMRMASVLVSLDEDQGLRQCCAAASHALQVPVDQLRKELSACRKAGGPLQGAHLAECLLTLQAGHAVVRAGGVPGSPSTAALQQRICEVTGLDEHMVNSIMVALCLPTGDDAPSAIAHRLRVAIDQHRQRATLEMQIAEHLAARFISNPDFELLQRKANQLIEYASGGVFEVHCWAGRYTSIYETGDKSLIALRHMPAMDGRGVRAIKAELDRVQAVGHPFFVAMKAFYESHLELIDKLEALKGIVSPVSKVCAERKQAHDATDSRSVVTQPLVRELMAHLDEYVARADTIAREQIDEWLALLAHHKWDMDSAAPMLAQADPHFAVRQHLRVSLQGITEPLNPYALNYRTRSAAKCAMYVRSTKQQARLAFKEWINRMTARIAAPVVQVQVIGDLWVSSFLKVITDQGDQQTWQCRMNLIIENGLLVPEFPSEMVSRSPGPGTPAPPAKALLRGPR